MTETKEDKFKRLAEKRVNAALDKIRLIGNLASSQYAYSPEQIETIISAMHGAVGEVEVKFQKPLQRQKEKFEL